MAATAYRESATGDGIIIARPCYVHTITLTSDGVGAGVVTLHQNSALGAVIGELRTGAADRSVSVSFKGFRVHRQLHLENMANCVVIIEYE